MILVLAGVGRSIRSVTGLNMDLDLRQTIKEIFQSGYLMSLATQDDGGVWVADLIYIFDDDLNIYWMSDPDVRHSQALQRNSSVAASISANNSNEDNLGVQIEGEAKKIDGPRFDLALKQFAKRNKPIPSESDDVLDGDSWYMLMPKRIELIDEKNFGFEKQIHNF